MFLSSYGEDGWSAVSPFRKWRLRSPFTALRGGSEEPVGRHPAAIGDGSHVRIP